MARAGKMSGNLFQERNWVASERLFGHGRKKGKNVKPYPNEDKTGELDPREEKCGWGSDCPFCKAQKKEGDPPHQQKPMEGQQ